MAAIAAERYTGASIKRSEDQRILTGAGRYVDDIKLPGMLHAAFGCSRSMSRLRGRCPGSSRRSRERSWKR